MANGFGLAAGALSQAFSDMFKGLSEGEEGRRKEEEAGRRARAEITEQAYQPLRFQAANLQNQQTAQAIELAKAQEGRNVAAEQREAIAFSPAQRAREAQATIAETGATYAIPKAEADLKAAESAYKLTQQQLKEAEAGFDFLVPGLKRKAELEAADLATKKFALDKAKKDEAGESEASLALLAAGDDPAKVDAVLKKYGHFINPHHPYVQLMKARIEAQSRAEGVINPIARFNAERGVIAQARDDAAREAERQLMSIYGPVAVQQGDEPGIDQSRAWLYQYAYSRMLRAGEKPELGIVFSETAKHIPAMPPELIIAAAKNPTGLAGVIGMNLGQTDRLGIYKTAEKYLVQGMEWSRALETATKEYASLKEKGLIPQEEGVLGKAWSNIKESFGAPPKIPKVPIPLPPGVEEHANKIKQNRITEIMKADPDLKRFSWEEILQPHNSEWKEYIEKMYERKYGEKP